MLHYQNLAEAVEASGAIPDRGVVFIKNDTDEKFVSYQTLFGKSLKVLSYLQENGVQPGDELLFQLDDNQIFIMYFWACILGGIIPVPVTVSPNDEHKFKVLRIWEKLKNPSFIATKKNYLDLEEFVFNQHQEVAFDRIKAKTVLVEDPDNIAKTGLIYQAKRNDIAFIQFSSGSTGEPKGVILTHHNLLTNIQAMIKAIEMTRNDSTLSWMPLTHDMGLIGFHLTPTVCQSNQYLIPTPTFIRQPVLWIKKTNDHQATILSSPNFGYKHFLHFFKPETANGWDLSHVRLIFNGAEPISSKLVKDFLKTMEPFRLSKETMFPVYGLAEAVLGVTFPPINTLFHSFVMDRDFLGSGQNVQFVSSENEGATFMDLGYPVQDCSVRICNHENQSLNEDIIGLVYIKGGNVTSGYYNDPKATASLLNDEGWLNTGDLGFIHNGRLILTGRVKDIVFINGQNYYLHDIEALAQKMDGTPFTEVVACRVQKGESPEETVVLFGYWKKEIEDFVPQAINLRKYLNRVLGFEIREIIPIKKIPKTTSGKVQRYKLAQDYQNGEFSEALEAMRRLENNGKQQRIIDEPLSETERRLVKVYQKVFQIPEISVYDNFIEMGGNSFLLTQIQAELEILYPGRVTIPDLFAFPTISKLAGLIQSKDPLILERMAFPREYFGESNVAACGISYEYFLNGMLYQKLKKAAQGEAVSANDILLAILIHLLKELTGEEQVVVHSITRKNGPILSITINYDRIKTFSDLFMEIYRRRQGEGECVTFPMPDLAAVKLNHHDFSIRPLFYQGGGATCGGVKDDLLDVFDLVLEIDEKIDQVVLCLKYNLKRLKGEKMREFLQNYLSMLNLLLENYQFNEAEVAI